MDDIHGLKPYMIFAPNWKLLLLVGLGITLMGALAWMLVGARPKRTSLKAAEPEIPENAPASVRAQLDELVKSGLVQEARAREFHVLLSALVRGFLGKHFDLPGRRFTTTEIVMALSDTQLADETLRLISEILLRCDIAKFAEFVPDRSHMEALLRDAYRLLDLLGDTETPVEWPEGAQI